MKKQTNDVDYKTNNEDENRSQLSKNISHNKNLNKESIKNDEPINEETIDDNRDIGKNKSAVEDEYENKKEEENISNKHQSELNKLKNLDKNLKLEYSSLTKDSFHDNGLNITDSEPSGKSESLDHTDGYFNHSIDKLLQEKYGDKENTENDKHLGNDNTENNHGTSDRKSCYKSSMITIIAFTAGVMLILSLSIAIVITSSHRTNHNHYHGEEPLPNEKTSETYSKAAVVSAAPICSKIGADVLRMKGSAVDAAIATCFCAGVVSKHSSGIGGGGFMLVYNRNKNVKNLSDRFDAIDFRESAPGRATQNMFSDEKSRYGGKTIAIPGEVKGLYYAFKLYGKLPWRVLVEPSIYLARNGFAINNRLQTITNLKKLLLQQDIGIRRIMFGSNNEARPAGYVLKDELLAKTLEKVRDNPDSFYNGELADKIVKDVQQAGGIITLDDLANYKVKRRRVIRDQIDNFKFFTIGAPAGGPVVAQVLNILKSDHLKRSDVDTPNLNKVALTYHRILEAMKFAFAKKTGVGDPDFNDQSSMYKLIDSMVNDTEGQIINRNIDNYYTHDYSYYRPQYAPNYEYGTSHINVIAENGDAVSLTSSINDWFGSGYRSTDTGIIYNNQMIDFSIKPYNVVPLLPLAQANFIHSGKRPAASMSQIIMTNSKGDVRFVIGGAGGKKIIPAVVLVIINKLWFGDTLEHAISRKRFYTTLFPNRVKAEKTDSRDAALIALLRQKQHFVIGRETVENSEVLGIFVRKDGGISASTDVRRHSHSDGY